MAAITPLLKFIEEGTVGAEIGVRAGDSSELILQIPGTRLLCIDPWSATPGYGESLDYKIIKAEAMRKLSPFGDRATIVECISSEASLLVDEYSLDFAFLDGNHSFPFVLADCLIWWPKIKPGGILCGHDIGIHKPPTHEAKRAVDRFSHNIGRPVEAHGECWLIRK
jgi:hypothetical protein